jgi:hypothetical protein
MLCGFADKTSLYTAHELNFDFVRHRDGAVLGCLKPKHANQVNDKERPIVVIADNQNLEAISILLPGTQAAK